MGSHVDLLIDKIFFGFSFLVALFVALRPVAFFRTITLGRFNVSDYSPTHFKVIQLLAVVVAIGSAIRVISDIFQQSK